ncbi:MAG: bifunctional sulfate adenylyltransferase/adenylylsulfate kinase [Thermodesulfobacteriota bacterium]
MANREGVISESELVNLVADERRAAVLKDEALGFREIIVNNRQLCDLDMMATGVFSPLRGFMSRADYESVLERMRLTDGRLFPVPVCLDVSAHVAETLQIGQPVALRDQEGLLLAVMHIDDIWPVEREREAEAVYGTSDPSHPGVHYLLAVCRDYYVGGQLEVVQLPIHFDSRQLRRTPLEIRQLYKKLGWQRVVGFHTRQPIHRPQFEMTMRAMRIARANLLCLPSVGTTHPGDFDHYIRVRCYKRVAEHYPPDSFVLNLLPMAMRMAGPREALLHLIISANFGCTDFIIGPDHGSPEKKENGEPFYSSGQAAELARACSEEVGVQVIPFKEIVYLPFEDAYLPVDEVPDGSQCIALSSAMIRKRLGTGKKIPEWATFPEVLEELERAYPPPAKQGFTLFLTGLSGAGKSTIAKILYARFLEIGTRPVTLLDGDIVRHNLSSELTFSREHRDINVKRIGFVASEITKNRGIAICAPIAPYAATRNEVRRVIEAYGGFIEVHISTPIEECEKRDRKGMYAKARAGLITGFTGIDDPYQVPESPDISIDTTHLTPDEAVQAILVLLGERGFI